MINHIVSALRNYANFGGRATRPEFWTFMLFFAVLTVAAHYVDAADGMVEPIAAGMGILELSLFLMLILPTITVGARRLHDTGRSGWWLLFLYVPYLAFVAAMGHVQATIAASASLLVGALVLAVQLCLAGDVGDNRYGPNPASPDPIV
jgi:uncharacterized membrane protein YhaH (DUF805 family)